MGYACPAKEISGQITVVQIFYFDSGGRLQMYRIWSDQVAEYTARIYAEGGVVLKDIP